MGAVGDGTNEERSLPVAVDMSGVLAGKTVTQISAGTQSSLALTADGDVYAWGRNLSGELGDGTTTHRYSPVAVDTSGVLAGVNIVQAVSNNNRVMALSTDGRLFAWGSNGNGQLGDGTTANSSVPVAVDMTGVLAGKTVTSISAGGGHTFALADDGTAYAWGLNYAGQLGDGSTDTRLTAVAVDMSGALAGKSIEQISPAHDSHTLILTTDGGLFGMGANWYGMLGDDTTDDSAVVVAADLSQYDPVIASITFGGQAASDVMIVDSSTLRATAPAHSPQLVDVVVTFVDQAPITLANAFEYIGETGGSETPSPEDVFDSTTPDDESKATLADTGSTLWLVGLAGVGLLAGGVTLIRR